MSSGAAPVSDDTGEPAAAHRVAGARGKGAHAAAGGETIAGSPGDDSIGGSAGDDSITGGAGNDWITAGPVGIAASGVSSYTIATFAGHGRPSLGDGGPATAATLADPDRVLAVAGLVYIADTANNRIAIVDSSGTIRTLAGSVSAENQALGNGGIATDAVVRFPHALFHTQDGLYIGDHSYTVRLVDPSGIIHHAGLPDRAAFILPSAVAVDSSGRIYIADITHHRVLRSEIDGSVTIVAGTGVAGTSGDEGPGILAQINAPTELRFDAQGHLLIGSAAAPLRKLDLSTGVITTRLSNTMSDFDIAPSGEFIVGRGNQVLRIDPTSGVETVIAGTGGAGFSGDGGLALSAQFNNIQGVSVDGAGNIFVVDAGNDRIREITADGIVRTFAGGGPSVSSLTSMVDSQGIAFDPYGNLYTTDFQYHHIRRVLPDGTTRVVAGSGQDATSGDGGAAVSAAFDHPSILRFDKFGNLYFLDSNHGTAAVRKIHPGTDGVVTGAADEIITTVAGRNVDRALADHGSADGGLARDAVFVAARDFLFDSRGNLIVADWLDNRIRKVTPGADGVLNGGSDELITTIAGNGGLGQAGDGGLAIAAVVQAPSRLAIDAHDNLYVFVGVNTPEASIRRIDADTGLITTLARGMHIADMIVDHAGRLFYTDGTARVVQVDTTTGAQTVVAGSGQAGFGGDGAAALQALFRGASWLAVDANNSLYVVDNGNFRIRVLLDTDRPVSSSSGDNTLLGGAGNDTIVAVDGSNYLRGEDGSDSIQGGISFDDLHGNMGDDTVSGGGGGDWVVGGKDQDRLYGEGGGDIVLGNLGNDTCEGGPGQDVVRGGQGDDVVRGSADRDYVSGDRGSDTVSGGAGADFFHSFAEAGLDRVLDFNASEGDRVMLDPGTVYTASQVGADVIIDMGSGNEMILVGVQLNALPPNWIFESWVVPWWQ